MSDYWSAYLVIRCISERSRAGESGIPLTDAVRAKVATLLEIIAEACGFRSFSHFYGVFRSLTGRTPHRFRASAARPPALPVKAADRNPIARAASRAIKIPVDRASKHGKRQEA